MRQETIDTLCSMIAGTTYLSDVDYAYYLDEDGIGYHHEDYQDYLQELIYEQEVIYYHVADTFIAEHGYKKVVEYVLEEALLDATQLRNSELVATVYLQHLMTQELQQLDLDI